MSGAVSCAGGGGRLDLRWLEAGMSHVDVDGLHCGLEIEVRRQGERKYTARDVRVVLIIAEFLHFHIFRM